MGVAAGNLDSTSTPQKKKKKSNSFIAARSVICSSTSCEMGDVTAAVKHRLNIFP